ncbi:hypothetical protein [Aquiflexum lacus]|uniref:hypothetical protein n=1 Tax=Aquiflexum lacus TaxID=2483805 RepID=UPI0018956784|nr:hypothetical protein [Aquiflexum lacus]
MVTKPESSDNCSSPVGGETYNSPGQGAGNPFGFNSTLMHRRPGSEGDVLENFGAEPSLLEQEVFYRNGKGVFLRRILLMLFLVSNVYTIFLSFPLLLFCPEKIGTGFDQKSNKKVKTMRSYPRARPVPACLPNRQARLPAILRDRLLFSRPLSCEMRVEVQIKGFSAVAPKWAIYDSPGQGASKFLRFPSTSLHRSPGSEGEVIQNFGTEPSLLEREVSSRNGRKA